MRWLLHSMWTLPLSVCTGGQYCDRSNLTAPAGDCTAGYYCTRGVDTPTPSGGHTGVGGICPTGHYCPNTTTNPQGCDAGTYQVCVLPSIDRNTHFGVFVFVQNFS